MPAPPANVGRPHRPPDRRQASWATSPTTGSPSSRSTPRSASTRVTGRSTGTPSSPSRRARRALAGSSPSGSSEAGGPCGVPWRTGSPPRARRLHGHPQWPSPRRHPCAGEPRQGRRAPVRGAGRGGEVAAAQTSTQAQPADAASGPGPAAEAPLPERGRPRPPAAGEGLPHAGNNTSPRSRCRRATRWPSVRHRSRPRAGPTRPSRPGRRPPRAHRALDEPTERLHVGWRRRPVAGPAVRASTLLHISSIACLALPVCGLVLPLCCHETLPKGASPIHRHHRSTHTRDRPGGKRHEQLQQQPQDLDPDGGPAGILVASAACSAARPAWSWPSGWRC